MPGNQSDIQRIILDAVKDALEASIPPGSPFPDADRTSEILANIIASQTGSVRFAVSFFCGPGDHGEDVISLLEANLAVFKAHVRGRN